MKLKNLFAPDKKEVEQTTASLPEEVCCGQHEICEKEELLKSFRRPVEYYDDHELDLFRGRQAASYTDDEVGQFAEVLHTMWESDVPGWLRSLQLRGIELPEVLRDEVILLVSS